MKKLVVALISLLAVAFAAGSGFAAEKPATAAPVKADTQVKPADAGKATQTKTDAVKQPGASKKTDSGKQPDASKKTDAPAPATGAQAGAVTQDNPATTRASRRHHAPAAHIVKSKPKKYVHAKRHAKHHARAVQRRHRHHVRHHARKHAAVQRVNKHVKKHAHGAVQVHKSGKASKSAVEPKKVVKPAEPKKEVKPVEPKKESSTAGTKKDNKPAEVKKDTK
jgi:hypothetical protein